MCHKMTGGQLQISMPPLQDLVSIVDGIGRDKDGNLPLAIIIHIGKS
jgi:hypothetical protein